MICNLKIGLLFNGLNVKHDSFILITINIRCAEELVSHYLSSSTNLCYIMSIEPIKMCITKI